MLNQQPLSCAPARPAPAHVLLPVTLLITLLVFNPNAHAAGLLIADGGFGGMLFRANGWTTQEQILRS